MTWLLSPIGRVHHVGADRKALCGAWTLESHDNPPPAPPDATHCPRCVKLLPWEDPESTKHARWRETSRANARKRSEPDAEQALRIIAAKAKWPSASCVDLALMLGLTAAQVRWVVRKRAEVAP